MIVVDDGVAAVMGGGGGAVVRWWVGWVFGWWAPPFCPRFPLTLALSRGGERGLLVADQGVAAVMCVGGLVGVLSEL